MKQHIRYAAALISVVVLLIALDTVAGGLWVGQVRSRTIGAWCNWAGIPWFRLWALLLWGQLPTWGIISICGFLVGRKRPRSWLLDGSVLAILFVVGSYAWPRLVWGAVMRMPILELWLLDFTSVPLLIAVAFFSQRLVQRRLAKRNAYPLCDGCDYNLTGNTTGVCPECGEPIPDNIQERVASEKRDPSK